MGNRTQRVTTLVTKFGHNQTNQALVSILSTLARANFLTKVVTILASSDFITAEKAFFPATKRAISTQQKWISDQRN